MFVIALLPESRLHEYPSFIDHVVKDGGHVLGFLIFVFFLRLSFMFSFGRHGISEHLSLTTGPFLAGLTEMLQSYSPGREPNPWDFTLDIAGAMIGTVLALWAYRKITEQTADET